tara:strand:+ start:3882 stop:5195 length:1314 start_codon:yes stop_codon:yes gene_type:complete
MEKLEYEGNIKNVLLDPVLDVKNVRNEFRITNDDSNRVVLSSMRLSLGVTKAGAGHYNDASGCYGLIRNIFLMDGNQVLDQCLNANGYLAFTNYLGENDENASRNKVKSRGNNGYFVDGFSPADDTMTGGVAPRSDVLYRNTIGQITNTQDSFVNTGYLDLKRCLPLLGNIDAIPLAVFPNLRLVVEYETDANKILENTANASTTIRALLSFDEVTDDQEKQAMSRAFKGVTWLSIEHDRVNVPATSPANNAANVRTEQVSNNNVKNFRGKYLSKLVVAKNPTDTSLHKAGNQNSPMGAYASVLGIDERINVRINGANKLPTDNDRPNKRLAMLTDIWGVANAYPLNNVHGSDRDYFILAQFNGSSDRKLQVGVQDYFGLSVEDNVNDMELLYTRKDESTNGGTDNGQYSTALNLNMWGLCRKSITMSGNQYRVVYA